jgi:hypothetical protein
VGRNQTIAWTESKNGGDLKQCQVESGIKLIIPCKTPTFVFAAFWPSWMFAAKACGFKDIKVCVDDLSDEVHEALRCIMEDGQVLVALKEWKQALENVLKDEAIDRIIILLQGKQLVTGKVLQWLELKVRHMKQTMRIHLISEIDSAGDASMNEEGQETR